MTTTAPLQNSAAKSPPLSTSAHRGLLLERKCACGAPTSSLSGQCAECGGKQLQRSALKIDAPEPALRRKAGGMMTESSEHNGAPPIVHEVLRSPGQPLDAATRAFMEPRFGHDFSRVRVHSGAAAEQSARDVDADAYTVGHDVVFGAGRLAPESHEGRRLLAHELTHVVQQTVGSYRSRQGATGGAALQGAWPPSEFQSDDVAEQEAHRVSRAIVGTAAAREWPIHVSRRTVMLQRQPIKSKLSSSGAPSLNIDALSDDELFVERNKIKLWLAQPENKNDPDYLYRANYYLNLQDVINRRHTAKEAMAPPKMKSGQELPTDKAVDATVERIVGKKPVPSEPPEAVEVIGMEEAFDLLVRGQLFPKHYDPYEDPEVMQHAVMVVYFLPYVGAALSIHDAIKGETIFEPGVKLAWYERVAAILPVGIGAVGKAAKVAKGAIRLVSRSKVAFRLKHGLAGTMMMVDEALSIPKLPFKGTPEVQIVFAGEMKVSPTALAAAKQGEWIGVSFAKTSGDAAAATKTATVIPGLSGPSAAKLASPPPVKFLVSPGITKVASKHSDPGSVASPVEEGGSQEVRLKREFTAEEKAASKKLESKMAADREAEAMAKLQKDAPDLAKEVASSQTTMADGKTTLRDFAQDSPEQLKAMYAQWKHGVAKGEIKTQDFGKYVKSRQSEFRGRFGELEDAFRRGPNEIMVKAPKENVSTPGSDSISYDTKTDRIKYLDNKSVKPDATVSKVSALEKNLPKNLGDDIADIKKITGKPGVPKEIGDKVLPRLEAAKAEIDAYILKNKLTPEQMGSLSVQKDFAQILDKHGIDRVVTFGGAGQGAGISGKLSGPKGFKTE